MNQPTPVEPSSPESSVYWQLRLRVQERLYRCLHHELRGALNGAGLQLTLLGRLSSGSLDDRPELKARSGDWVEAARSELDALQAWSELSTWLMTPLADPPVLSDFDAAATIREFEPLLTALARRSGVALTLELPETASVRAAPELFRWTVLDATVSCLEVAAAESRDAVVALRVESSAVALDLNPPPPLDEISRAARLGSGDVLEEPESGGRWASTGP